MACNFWASSQWEQWTFDKAQLLQMRAEDLKNYSEEEYKKFMIFWANFIQDLANESLQGQNKVRMQVVLTAVVYFKRFFLRKGFKDVCPFALSCTSLLLASKAEEHGQMSLSKMASSIPTCLKKIYNINYELKHQIPYDIEFILVETMDCCLIVFHPHRALNLYIADLQKDTTLKDLPALEAQCWKVANDSIRCDACLLFPPHIIACASMIVAAVLMYRENDLKGFLNDLSIDSDKVMECVSVITEMYQIWKGFIERDEVPALVDRLPKINVPQQASHMLHQ